MSDRKVASREYHDKLAPIYDQHSHAKHLEALYAELIETADGCECRHSTQPRRRNRAVL